MSTLASNILIICFIISIFVNIWLIWYYIKHIGKRLKNCNTILNNITTNIEEKTKLEKVNENCENCENIEIISAFKPVMLDTDSMETWKQECWMSLEPFGKDYVFAYEDKIYLNIVGMSKNKTITK